MRKVTQNIIEAFMDCRSLTIGNTRTDGASIFLHGTRIIKYMDGNYYFTLAGWNTLTTRERINGFLEWMGMRGISVKKGTAYFNGSAINDDGWYCIEEQQAVGAN